MASTHNERIKQAYGNFCFWSWFRYWYVDSANLVTMILMDKGYYDYDYEQTAAPVEYREKTQEELENALSQFGIGQRPKPQSEEEIQEYIIKDMEEK